MNTRYFYTIVFVIIVLNFGFCIGTETDYIPEISIGIPEGTQQDKNMYYISPDRGKDDGNWCTNSDMPCKTLNYAIRNASLYNCGKLCNNYIFFINGDISDCNIQLPWNGHVSISFIGRGILWSCSGEHLFYRSDHIFNEVSFVNMTIEGRYDTFSYYLTLDHINMYNSIFSGFYRELNIKGSRIFDCAFDYDNQDKYSQSLYYEMRLGRMNIYSSRLATVVIKIASSFLFDGNSFFDIHLKRTLFVYNSTTHVVSHGSHSRGNTYVNGSIRYLWIVDMHREIACNIFDVAEAFHHNDLLVGLKIRSDRIHTLSIRHCTLRDTQIYATGMMPCLSTLSIESSIITRSDVNEKHSYDETLIIGRSLVYVILSGNRIFDIFYTLSIFDLKYITSIQIGDEISGNVGKTFNTTLFRIEDSTSIEMAKTKFLNNSGSYCTFCIFDSSLVSVVDSEFRNNQAIMGGGILVIVPFSQMSITNTIFDNNSAVFGGALVCSGEFCDVIKISKTTFIHNKATWGGAIGAFFKEGVLESVLVNNHFQNNTIEFDNRENIIGSPYVQISITDTFDNSPIVSSSVHMGDSLMWSVSFIDSYGQEIPYNPYMAISVISDTEMVLINSQIFHNPKSIKAQVQIYHTIAVPIDDDDLPTGFNAKIRVGFIHENSHTIPVYFDGCGGILGLVCVNQGESKICACDPMVSYTVFSVVGAVLAAIFIVILGSILYRFIYPVWNASRKSYTMRQKLGHDISKFWDYSQKNQEKRDEYRILSNMGSQRIITETSNSKIYFFQCTGRIETVNYVIKINKDKYSDFSMETKVMGSKNEESPKPCVVVHCGYILIPRGLWNIFRYSVPDECILFKAWDYDLAYYLDNYCHTFYTFNHRMSILRKIVKCSAWLHSNSIFHRDYKPWNFLCRKDPSNNLGIPFIALSDFGTCLSEVLTDGTEGYKDPDIQGLIEENDDLVGSDGRLVYTVRKNDTDEQMIEKQEKNKNILQLLDVYSFSMVMLDVITVGTKDLPRLGQNTGTRTFPKKETIISSLNEREIFRMTEEEKLSIEKYMDLCEYIYNICNGDREKRPTFGHIDDLLNRELEDKRYKNCEEYEKCYTIPKKTNPTPQKRYGNDTERQNVDQSTPLMKYSD